MATLPTSSPSAVPADSTQTAASVLLCHAPGDRLVTQALTAHVKRALAHEPFEWVVNTPDEALATPGLSTNSNPAGSISADPHVSILLLVLTQRSLGDESVARQVDAALSAAPASGRCVVVAQMQRCEACTRWPALAGVPLVDFVTMPFGDACAHLTLALRQAAADAQRAINDPGPSRESLLAAVREERWADVQHAADWLEAALQRSDRVADHARDAELWRALSQAYNAMGRPADALAAINRARTFTPLDDLETRMDLLMDRLTLQQHEWHLKLLRVVDQALEQQPELLDQQSERLGHLVELQRQEDALEMARQITMRPGATLNQWLTRARLARVVLAGEEAEREVAQALEAVESLAPGDPSAALACADLRRTPAPLDGLPERLEARGYILERRDGVEVVLPPLCDVPAGAFLMGSDPAHDPAAFADERPQHRVALERYRIMRFPVTVAEYLRFVRAGQRAPVTWRGQLAGLDRPVTAVPWSAARAYAAWLTRLTGQRWRLPTEAEWEKAARWDEAAQHARIYPWGDTFDPMRANTGGALVETLLPVGIFLEGASPVGMEDAAGNIWEWTSSHHMAYPYQADDGREAQRPAGNHVVRGGSRALDPEFARAACRGYRSAVDFGPQIGFRLVCEGAGA